ncbi:Endopolyphosphatase [Saitoella complicata NRRL Y-17804]|nr:Endopolyphosphatase [Saitoella complicata NRRL Y-17804]ODQ55757.1 Endopolyphosphatase [Saitoella complicata NRRL Y-17804]
MRIQQSAALLSWALLFGSSVNAAQLPLSFQNLENTASEVETVYHSKLHGRFMHVTDFHPDRNYREGALVDNNCHFHGKDGKKDKSLEGLKKDKDKDKDDDEEEKAGYWGYPASGCDAPWTLVDATFEWIDKEWKDKIDFVIWTGDSVRHDNDNNFPRTQKEIFQSNADMIRKFEEVFHSDDPTKRHSIPIVPTMGNNDVWPHNIMRPGPNPTTLRFAQLWSHFVPEEQMHTFQRGAYFWREVIPNKLAVISLNTLYWFESNAAVDGCDAKEDAGSLQFEWLKIQLNILRSRGMKAYLIGHVPPTEKYYPTCLMKYVVWSNAFRDVIIGHFFGHANVDHFIMLNEKDVLDRTELRKATRDFLEIDADEYDDHNGTLRIMGKENYMAELRDYFRHMPDLRKYTGRKREQVMENWMVANVVPSIIPTYFPAARVVEYNVTGYDGGHAPHRGTLDMAAVETTEDSEDHVQEGVEEDSEVDASKKKGKKKKGKKKRPKHKKPPADAPAPPAPGSPLGPAFEPQFLTPIKYTQYYANITKHNEEKSLHGHENLTFEVEYETDGAPYHMQDLTVPSYMELAKKIAGDAKRDDKKHRKGKGIQDLLKKKKKKGKKGKKGKKPRDKDDDLWFVYLKRAFVQTKDDDDIDDMMNA